MSEGYTINCCDCS